MTPPAEASSWLRRRYVDWVRGLAVLIMMEAHALDAWTHTSSRHGVLYQQLMMLGGFAAPLFLWLAGLSLALSAERTLERTGSRAAAASGIVRRGAEIFILAFVFRLQALVVSPGSWLVTVFRVDILNVLGIAIACSGLAWGLAQGVKSAVAVTGVVAIAVAMVTPVVREAAWVDRLPLWFQWHVRPFGEHTTFTLFPWAGFAFAGASVGTLLAHARSQSAERRLLGLLGVVGAALTWLGFYTAALPSIYHASFFWTSSPTFFAIRAGVLLMALTAVFLAAEFGPVSVPGVHALEVFGRNSLFVYWIHVEIVYGYITWGLHRRLPLWGTTVAYAALTVLMYFTVIWRDRLLERWRGRGVANSTAGAMPA